MYSLHELDEKILGFLKHKNGIFIECGANDGISQSNTLLLEQKLNWTGLLIEPSTINFNKCLKNRPNCIVENYALVSADNKEDYIYGNFDLNAFNGLMNFADNFPDYFDDHMKYYKNKFKIEHAISSSKKQCCTLQYLIDKHNLTNIDFFSLDVEGYEIEVLKGIDFQKNRPKYILVETTEHEYYVNIINNFMNSIDYISVKKLSINDMLYKDSHI